MPSGYFTVTLVNLKMHTYEGHTGDPKTSVCMFLTCMCLGLEVHQENDG